MRASPNVIHPRSSGGNADNDRASAASVVPSSFIASAGEGTPIPNSFPIRTIIPMWLRQRHVGDAAKSPVISRGIPRKSPHDLSGLRGFYHILLNAAGEKACNLLGTIKQR